MLSSLKISLMLLWKGEKIWTFITLITIPLVFVILAVAEKTFPAFLFAFLMLVFLLDYTFVVTTQALDAAEILVFPRSDKQKYNFLFLQSALGVKFATAVIYIAYILIVYHAQTTLLMAFHLLLFYALYCMFFTNFLLLVKRRKIYSFLYEECV